MTKNFSRSLVNNKKPFFKIKIVEGTHNLHNKKVDD